MPFFKHFKNHKVFFKKTLKKRKNTNATKFKNKDLRKNLLLLSKLTQYISLLEILKIGIKLYT